MSFYTSPFERDILTYEKKVVQAVTRNEKEDALCPRSPTNVHFYGQRYDEYGNFVARPVDLYCDACSAPIMQRGPRWVIDPNRYVHERIDGKYVIQEGVEVEDLL